MAGIAGDVRGFVFSCHVSSVPVWEASVRATHHFLSEPDIQFFKPLVRDGLQGLAHLFCLRDMPGDLVGFVGVADGKMEALFVHPSWHRAGIGRRLAGHAMVKLGATAIDVNEQNEQAVVFYLLARVRCPAPGPGQRGEGGGR